MLLSAATGHVLLISRGATGFAKNEGWEGVSRDKGYGMMARCSDDNIRWIYMEKIEGIYEMKEKPDHIEYYKNTDGDVVTTFSAHIHTDDRIGSFKKYKPLYNTSQSSYVCVFPPSLKEITERAYVSINGVVVVLSHFKYNTEFKLK